MVQTITPVVHGGRRGRWIGSVAAYTVGALVSAAALGAVLAVLGRALGAPWGSAGLWAAAAVGSCGRPDRCARGLARARVDQRPPARRSDGRRNGGRSRRGRRIWIWCRFDRARCDVRVRRPDEDPPPGCVANLLGAVLAG